MFDEANFFSMSDGSVDAATIEGEIVYSKFVVKGKVYMHFVGIQAVERPNAAGIKGAICDVLKNQDEPWRR